MSREHPNPHQLTLRDTTLQTRIERIPTEQRQQLRLARKLLISSVIIAQSLEPGNTTHRLGRARLDMVDIVIVEDAKVWWRDFVVVRAAEAAAGEDNAFCCMSVVCCDFV
jgi:hypothetical protein